MLPTVVTSNAKALVALVAVAALTYASQKWTGLDAPTKTLISSVASALLVWLVPNRPAPGPPPPSQVPTVPPSRAASPDDVDPQVLP